MLQNLKTFTGDRSKFREWKDKLVNAFAQVQPDYRDAIKNLNKKLDTLEGIISNEHEEDIIKVLNDRLTTSEYARATGPAKQADTDKGPYQFNEVRVEKLDEDLWYVLNDKLEGIETRAKIKGLEDGDGIPAYQKIFKWYSAVTGNVLAHKVNQAMNPEPSKKVTEVAGKLEEWSS